MPIKTLLHRFQPAPLYIVLILSICYFSVQLILSHLTHALTLLMASYHMLCNIFALAGSIVTIKHSELHNENEKHYAEMNLKQVMAPSMTDIENKQIVATTENGGKQTTIVQVTEEEARLTERKRRELKTRNTFGWARIEILTMLIVCITLASLSFSLLVEALQTLVHIDHQDSMHLPVQVMILGFVGLLLNGFTYLLIGGYTLHQGNFLHINPMGKVVVEPTDLTMEGNALAKSNANQSADHQLKEDLKAELGKVHYRTRREGPAELLRDVSSTIFVIVCAVIVYFAKDKEHTAKFIDPVLSIFSCVLVVGLSYPYMKEACMILLQTIPGSIDMENFERNLVTKFPQIVSYHDLHIWQLSSHKYIATIHIIFRSHKLYEKTIDEVRSHFNDHSIAHVTIQPEFQTECAAIGAGAANNSSTECLMQCQHPDCADKVCCKDSMTDLREVSVCPGGEEENDKKSSKKNHHGHSHGHGHHGHSHKVENKYKNKAHKHGKGEKCKKEDKAIAKDEEIVEKHEMEMSETKKQQNEAHNANEVPIEIKSNVAVGNDSKTSTKKSLASSADMEETALRLGERKEITDTESPKSLEQLHNNQTETLKTNERPLSEVQTESKEEVNETKSDNYTK